MDCDFSNVFKTSVIKTAYRKSWILDAMTLDPWTLGLWTTGPLSSKRVDSLQLDAWTGRLDSGLLDPFYPIVIYCRFFMFLECSMTNVLWLC